MFALILVRVDPNNDCGMCGILMSIFTDFIAFKRTLFKCNRKNSGFGKYLIDECGFDREHIQSEYRKIGSIKAGVNVNLNEI